MQIIFYLLTGFVGGLHRACWGGYKDSPFEPYEMSKTLRSVIVGTVWGGVLFGLVSWLGLKDVSLVNIYFIAIGMDTLTTEFYKLFFRTENQDRYFIPSHFHFWNKKVTNDWYRGGIGLLLISLMVGIFSVLVKVDIASWTLPLLASGALIGFFAGSMEAFGGMWKDAPFEHFDKIKVWRSPIVGAFWGMFLIGLSSNAAILLFTLFGANRSSIELYKGFYKGMKSGKFKAIDPTFPKWKEKRKIFIAPYVFTWIFVICLWVLGK